MPLHLTDYTEAMDIPARIMRLNAAELLNLLPFLLDLIGFVFVLILVFVFIVQSVHLLAFFSIVY